MAGAGEENRNAGPSWKTELQSSETKDLQFRVTVNHFLTLAM